MTAPLRLNGRIHRLEATAAAALGLHHCRACGLRHVQPLTMDLARRIIGPVSLTAPRLWREPSRARRPGSACATHVAAIQATVALRDSRTGYRRTRLTRPRRERSRPEAEWARGPSRASCRPRRRVPTACRRCLHRDGRSGWGDEDHAEALGEHLPLVWPAVIGDHVRVRDRPGSAPRMSGASAALRAAWRRQNRAA